MATNPLIAQGTLLRIRASVNWTSFPNLNITAAYLTKEGIRLSLDGESTTYLPTMTGAVTSPEPYQMITLTASINKANGLADLYRQQMQNNCLIGDGTVYTDTDKLGTFPILNCAIESIREMGFNGEEAMFTVSFRGYWIVNNAMWDLI